MEVVVLMSRDAAAARDGGRISKVNEQPETTVGAAGNAVNQLGTLPLRF